MKKLLFKTAISAMLLIFTITNAESQDFKVRGRLHMDAFYGIHDAENFSNGFNNRRARLGAAGKISENWDGQIEVDFADGGISPNDFRLRRSFSNGARLWIGQFKVPMGLNELTSSNEITFLERSIANNSFVDSRRIGVAYEYSKDKAGLKSMVYGRALGQRGALKDDMPLGVGLRGYFAPMVGEGQFHVGASIAYENLLDTTAVTFRDRPEARDSKGGSVRLTGISVIDAKATLKNGVELLYINGPLSFEGEFYNVDVARYTGSNVSFFGYHVQSSYVINGARKYSKGSIRGVSPEEGGAWEIALRYSFVNLNNGDFEGGEQSNVTLGLNYYVTSKLRFMLNVIYADTDKSDKSPILGVVRAQYNF